MLETMSELWAVITANHYLDISIRLFLATLLGGLVGIEREQNNHPAGFRTHILVCVGSALIMLISMYGFEQFIQEHPEYVIADPARLAAQVVSGIGFLGAGTIIVHGGTIRGLTTAASLWVVAGIGLALGAGFYFGAGLATVLVLVSLVILNRWEALYIRKSQVYVLSVKMEDRPGQLAIISTTLGNKKIDIRKVSVEEAREEGMIRLSITLRLPTKDIQPVDVIDELQGLASVKEVIMDGDEYHSKI